MYIDDKPFALMELKDIMGEQRFHLEPISKEPQNGLKENALPDRTLKYEIVDVYKGDKNDDTVISELYFDGLEAH